MSLQPMIRGTYAGEPDNFKRCLELGFTFFQTDSDHISTNERAPGIWDWAAFDAKLKQVKDAGAHWIFFPHFAFPPPWYRTAHQYDRMTCLEHNESVEAFSLWEPLALEFLEHGMAALESHYGRGTDNIAAMFTGIQGDYGECMVMAGCRVHDPGQRADWEKRFGNTHNHYGFWCAEPKARADFRKTMLARFGGLEGLSTRWGTALASDEDVVYPATPAARRHFLDFAEWYYDGMLRYTRAWLRSANRHFDTPYKLLPLGGGDMDLRICQDNTALVKLAAQEGVKVRSTHGGFMDFLGNACGQLVQISTACRFYGVPMWSEPPSGIDAKRYCARVFEAICTGIEGFWDWHSNPVKPDNAVQLEKYEPFMMQDKPVVKACVLLPSTWLRLNYTQGLAREMMRIGGKLRSLVHFDLADEFLIADGALDQYDYLIHLEGDVMEASTAAKIRSWVEAGGVFLYTGRIESVEGTLLFENTGPAHCGKGLLYGVNASAEDETLALLRRWFHVEPPCGKALIPAVCADIGGVCGVVLESGRAFLYNSTDVPAQKAVDGTLHTVEPHTIIQVR
jgi:hypothetical protein